MMMMGLFSGISEDVANFFRDFLWKLIETEIDCVRNLINALVNPVIAPCNKAVAPSPLDNWFLKSPNVVPNI